LSIFRLFLSNFMREEKSIPKINQERKLSIS
jgi:hypothetical protein